VEIHEEYGDAVVGLFRSAGFGDVSASMDLRGKDRFVLARL
jgi:methylase of polypeptide subunit release factors